MARIGITLNVKKRLGWVSDKEVLSKFWAGEVFSPKSPMKYHQLSCALSNTNRLFPGNHIWVALKNGAPRWTTTVQWSTAGSPLPRERPWLLFFFYWCPREPPTGSKAGKVPANHLLNRTTDSLRPRRQLLWQTADEDFHRRHAATSHWKRAKSAPADCICF